MRGSSELHAWGDSNLYLRRRDRQILITVEQRAASGLNDIEIELADHGKGSARRLRQVDAADADPRPETPERRTLQALTDADTPLSQRRIRQRAATRHNTVGAIVRMLVREGRIHHDPEGRYSLVTSQSERAAPLDAANASRPLGIARFPVPGCAHPQGFEGTARWNRPPEPPVRLRKRQDVERSAHGRKLRLLEIPGPVSQHGAAGRETAEAGPAANVPRR